MVRGSSLGTLAWMALFAMCPQVAIGERVTSLHATAGVSTGVSDNLNGGPKDPPPDVAPRDGGAYTTASLGLLMLIESPYQTHELSYNLDTTLIVGAAGNESVISRAQWRGGLVPTRTFTLRGQAEWLHSFSSASLLPQFNSSSVGALPIQFSQSTSFSASEAIGWEVARRWRLLQGGGFRAFAGFNDGELFGLIPTDATGGVEGNGGAGFEHFRERTAAGLYGTVAYVTFSRRGPAGDDDQTVARGVARLSRSLGESVSVGGEGGAAVLLGAGDRTDKPRLIGQTSLFVTFLEDATIGIVAQRDVRPNLYIAHTVLTEQAQVSLLLPSFWLRDRVTRQTPGNLQIYAGYGRSRAIDLRDGVSTSPWKIYQAGAVARYSPRDNMTLQLSYSYAQQDGQPMLDNLFLPYTRHLISAGFFARFPENSEFRFRELRRQRYPQADELNFNEPETSRRTR